MAKDGRYLQSIASMGVLADNEHADHFVFSELVILYDIVSEDELGGCGGEVDRLTAAEDVQLTSFLGKLQLVFRSEDFFIFPEILSNISVSRDTLLYVSVLTVVTKLA